MYYYDGSYIRLKNAEIGYTFEQPVGYTVWACRT
jgi:hypothetical protein